ncbi:PEP-CTERM sorting domain-containing protein [Paucibacter sp. M5-1]|uniref:PEP-CTERM sorting domain-containing protein n=1 Tax=Paucibacter sp. M5-1 TaxID=3015998 RepID=UPI0022B914DE|nr:PEP-CTERM sorting domain-containing protein [Paucibacter sp. M5-1]MCZ7883438.1 PEP-CTERM sorting domain-containing protein [Paucibacter sp. M5-1]
MRLKKTAFALVGLCVATFAAAADYRTTLLGGLAESESSAWGVNQSGQVVGRVSTAEGGWRASLWEANGSWVALDLVGNTVSSRAVAINSSGQMVGSSMMSNDRYSPGYVATMWSKDGRGKALGTLGEGQGLAMGINDAGQAVGAFDHFGQSFETSAVRWDADGVAHRLASLGGSYNQANGINNKGQIVGYSGTASGGGSAVLWEADGSIKQLALLSETARYNWSTRINEQGQIAGLAIFSDIGVDDRPNTWGPDGSVQALDLAGAIGGAAYDLNDSGSVIVGYSVLGGGIRHATLWDQGVAKDLNSFIDAGLAEAGWYFSEARDINEQGWVVGEARNRLTGGVQAFVLSPVPEPSSYALMLGGMGTLLAWRRRATSKRA